jgi:hypothetical protein
MFSPALSRVDFCESGVTDDQVSIVVGETGKDGNAYSSPKPARRVLCVQDQTCWWLVGSLKGWFEKWLAVVELSWEQMCVEGYKRPSINTVIYTFDEVLPSTTNDVRTKTVRHVSQVIFLRG